MVGAASGQLALAPDNQFHQLLASAGYAISPAVRASAEVAVGRMTQDAPYLAATLNPALAVPALPATSLHGSARTLDASLRLTAAATERLRLSASLTHNERDNHTPSAAYPAVSTDMFLGLAPRINQPYGFTQDRLKLDAEYRGPKRLKLAGGFEHADLQRTLQEADTHEDKLWARVGAQVGENVSLALKLAHAERRNGDYVALATIDPAENPLLRKFNQADRTRDSAGLRGDFTVGEKVTVGIGIDFANDDYTHSPIGLTDGRSVDVGADVSVAVSRRDPAPVLRPERASALGAGRQPAVRAARLDGPHQGRRRPAGRRRQACRAKGQARARRRSRHVARAQRHRRRERRRRRPVPDRYDRRSTACACVPPGA